MPMFQIQPQGQFISSVGRLSHTCKVGHVSAQLRLLCFTEFDWCSWGLLEPQFCYIIQLFSITTLYPYQLISGHPCVYLNHCWCWTEQSWSPSTAACHWKPLSGMPSSHYAKGTELSPFTRSLIQLTKISSSPFPFIFSKGQLPWKILNYSLSSSDLISPLTCW